MDWSPARRVAFRFGFLLAALFLFPFPLEMVPKVEWLYEILTKPLGWMTSWVATDVLGLGELPNGPTGSGDTTESFVRLLSITVLAAVGAAIWSVLDRRRTAYPRLAAATIVVLRYYLAAMLLGYAFAKLSQFPPPQPDKLDQRVGDLSPMGMLWTFMGSSQPYSWFAGFAEGLGGVLLLWRRTHVAGALVGMAAMANVVALNFCYDVPVKLLSTELLLIGAIIFAPHARRLIGAVLGRATPEVPPRTRWSPRLELARLIAKVVFVGLLAYGIYDQIKQTSRWLPPRHELHGIWAVEKFALEGVERPPVPTDGERWHKLYLGQLRSGVRPMDGPVVRLMAKVDPTQRTISIKSKDGEEVWRYTLSTEGEHPTLVVDGKHRGKAIRAELRREPDPLLVTRGFHWIQEKPFNP